MQQNPFYLSQTYDLFHKSESDNIFDLYLL